MILDAHEFGPELMPGGIEAWEAGYARVFVTYFEKKHVTFNYKLLMVLLDE